ncbi:MAG: hypothetical protein IID37_06040 [Planctomycetes bacterium]|nr:hypothetical protein [Planctomycetota bacterium]
MLDSNRIVGGGMSLRSGPVLIGSDDLGAVWEIGRQEQGGDGSYILGPTKDPGGTLLYAVWHQASTNLTKLLISINGGRAWFDILPTIPRNSASGDPSGGIMYDVREHALYIANKGGNTNESFYIFRLAPAQQLGILTDMSETSIPTGEASYNHPEPHQSMARIPGV